MKHVSRVFVLTLLALGMACPAASGASVFIIGLGTYSCSQWLIHSAGDDAYHQGMGTWVDGYLSARNAVRAKAGQAGMVGQSTDREARDAWITTYCKEHPGDVLFQATEALEVELEKTGR